MSATALKTEPTPTPNLRLVPPQNLDFPPAANTDVEYELVETFAQKFLRVGFKFSAAMARWGNVAALALSCSGDSVQHPTRTPIIDAPPRSTPIEKWLAKIQELSTLMQRMTDLNVMIQVYEMYGLTSFAHDAREELEGLRIQMSSAADTYPIMGNRLEIRASASAAASSAPIADPVDLHADDDVRQQQLDAALQPLYPQLGRKIERLTNTLETLYLYLLEHGDTHVQIIDRILTLQRTLMAADRQVDSEDIRQCLGSLPDAFSAWQYNGVSKDEAWKILIQQAQRSGASTPKLWDEYYHHVHPDHYWGTYNLHYIYSAFAIRQALIVNSWMRHDRKNVFVTLDQFAEMGWTDDDVVALVRTMTSAISARNSAGLYMGYLDHLDPIHFELLPTVVAALGGRDPQRRPAVIATIGQLTRDTGQWYLDLAMQAIAQLNAAGKIKPDEQTAVTDASTWEHYLQVFFAEGMPPPKSPNFGLSAFENRFGYLREAPTDLQFWLALRKIRDAIPHHLDGLNHPDLVALQKDFHELGWTDDALIQLMRDMEGPWEFILISSTITKNFHLALRAAVALGAKKPANRSEIFSTLVRIAVHNKKEELRLELLQNLAAFAALPAKQPRSITRYIAATIRNIANSNLTTWKRVYEALKDRPDQQRAFVEGLRRRALHGDHVAARALHTLPKIFRGLEID